MNESCKETLKKLASDPELQKKYEEELHRIGEAKEVATDGEAIALAIHNVMGVDIPLSELEKAFADSQKLDLDDLDTVAGGHNWCWADYCCYSVLKHPDDTEDDDACWAEFCCFAMYYNTDDF